MPLPFETFPFYQRPFLLAWTFIHSLFTITVYVIIPIVAALAIILGLVFIVVAILAGIFKWEFGSAEVRARRAKKREREEREKTEGNTKGAERNDAVEAQASGGLGSSTGGGSDVAALDVKARLEIELELLAEMMDVRRERLEKMK
ncbi:hypothetical protein N7535_008130 [Penicillium sp. DV-2018c]|nr:hypothetical protein N7461_004166 [Penicillium sp. DV-2018c]KAJ5566492.1 hypothetical protein N7535_008130 [Penicillium sp. DV-2018c]